MQHQRLTSSSHPLFPIIPGGLIGRWLVPKTASATYREMKDKTLMFPLTSKQDYILYLEKMRKNGIAKRK
jgi:hypothetical protein